MDYIRWIIYKVYRNQEMETNFNNGLSASRFLQFIIENLKIGSLTNLFVE